MKYGGIQAGEGGAVGVEAVVGLLMAPCGQEKVQGLQAKP